MAKAIDSGNYTHQELVDKVNQWIAKSEVFVSVTTLKYIARSGRVNPFKSFVAKMLDLKPIITVTEDGTTTLLDKSFTEKGSQKNLLKQARKISERGPIWGYAITHADNLKTANWYASELTKMFKQEPEFIRAASPVLGANTGPGIVAVSILSK